MTMLKNLLEFLGFVNSQESTPEKIFSKEAFYDYLLNFHAIQVVDGYLSEFIELKKNSLAKYGFTYEGFVEYLLSHPLDGRLYELAKDEEPLNHSCAYLEKRDDGKHALFVLERGRPQGVGIFETREAAIRYEACAMWNSLEKYINNSELTLPTHSPPMS